MVGSAAIKQGRSANRKHSYFFLPKIHVYNIQSVLIVMLTLFHLILYLFEIMSNLY